MKTTIKQITLMGVLLLFAGAAFGQRQRYMSAKDSKAFRYPAPEIRDTLLDGKDLNHAAEGLDDIRFAHKTEWLWCYTLNGEFIGPWGLGVDKYAYESESTHSKEHKLQKPFVIRNIGPEGDSLVVDGEMVNDAHDGWRYAIKGHPFMGIINYKTDKAVKLLTLSELKEKYCPEVTGPVMYMVNKFFIITDQELYKFDEDFVWKIEVLPSEELLPIKDCLKSPFTIVRIFTKTRHNWHPTNIGE